MSKRVMVAVVSSEEPDDDSEEEDTGDSSFVDEEMPAIALPSKAKSRVVGLGLDRRVSMKVARAVQRNSAREACRNHFFLALSVGVWVAVFGLPEFSLLLSYNLFGQRGSGVAHFEDAVNTSGRTSESLANYFGEHRKDILEQRLGVKCGESDRGRMVNTAKKGSVPVLVPWNEASYGQWEHGQNANNHIWCGFFPSNYFAYWPNIAQFVIFSVYKNTGTTMSLATQGVVGTVLAGINMHVMVRLFPRGARGLPCSGNATHGDDFLVLWYRNSDWTGVRTKSLSEAWRVYKAADTGGLMARAIFDPDGKMQPSWYAPGWGEKLEQQYESLSGADCPAGGHLSEPNYKRYGEVVCMLNVALVTFLFLISKSAKNTIMFGLSWHLFFMMNFMNPAIGVARSSHNTRYLSDWIMTEHLVVEVTTLVGALVAVLATLVPCARLRNGAMLEDDMNEVTLRITDIWDDAVRYLFGKQRSAKRFQIETAIDALSKAASEADDHINGAWWETLGCGWRARQRWLLKTLETYPTNIRDILYVVKTSVLSETFDGEHNVFMQQVQEPAEALCLDTQRLLWVCSAACTDGTIDASESRKIDEAVEVVKGHQATLLAAFRAAGPTISADLSEEQLFLFALSMWARRTTDFAESLSSLEHDQHSRHDSVIEVMVRSLAATWDIRSMLHVDHVLFAIRNFLSIMTVFLLSYYNRSGPESHWYSTVMPVTLSLLMVSEGSHHVEYEKSTHRLLGVTLGKCLPIVTASALGMMPCVSYGRPFAQGATIVLYVTFFVFVYFDSDMWSYVGCLVAGFGVYQLMEPCSDFKPAVYAGKYRELGSMIVAIFIHGFLQALLQRRSARDLFVERVRKLTTALDAAFEAIFESDVNLLQAALSDVTEHLAAAKSVLPECDPKLQIFRGRFPPFSTDFGSSSLRHVETLAAELDMILTSAKAWVASAAGDYVADAEAGESTGVLELLNASMSMKSIRTEVSESMQTVAEILPLLLANTGDRDSMLEQLRPPEQVRAAMSLSGAADLYRELSQASGSLRCSEQEELTNHLRVRVTIVVRSIQNAAFHLGRIEEGCIREAGAIY